MKFMSMKILIELFPQMGEGIFKIGTLCKIYFLWKVLWVFGVARKK